MAVADIVILSILLVSVLISIIRGFVREALSLAGWVLAFWIAVKYAPVFEGKLAGTVTSDSLRFITVFIGLFLATILATVIVNNVLSKIVKIVGLSGADRMLGMLFGAARGILILCVLVFAAHMVSLNKERWWNDSRLIVHVEKLNNHLFTKEFIDRVKKAKEQYEKSADNPYLKKSKKQIVLK